MLINWLPSSQISIYKATPWFCLLPLLVSRILLTFIFAIRTLLSRFSSYLRSTNCCDIHTHVFYIIYIIYYIYIIYFLYILYTDRQLTSLCKLQIRMKVFPPNTQRNWNEAWTLQGSLWRTWNVLPSDKDLQHNVAAWPYASVTLSEKFMKRMLMAIIPLGFAKEWGPISEEFRTLHKEKRECLGYKPDKRRFWLRFSGQCHTVFLATASRLVLRAT